MEDPEYDMFSFFEMTLDLVCIAGKDGFFRKVNNAVLQKLEYTEEELFANPISSFQHPDDKDITANTRAELLRGTALINFENRYITKTGKIIWLHWTSVYMPDKEVVFAIAKDITRNKLIEIKAREETKKFKGLAAHFKTNIENDRKAFAFELHEDIAQLASSIKMDINMVKSMSNDLNESAQARLESASIICQSLIDKIRKISFTISPYMLEQLGLNETLQRLCKEFTSINNIPCTLNCSYNEADLSTGVAMDFFRICQESLSNIVRNAVATFVEISITDCDKEICLTIIDDGEYDQRESTSFNNMHNIATLIDGKLNISKHGEKGTKVCFIIGKRIIINN